jgi:hypothetical protein
METDLLQRLGQIEQLLRDLVQQRTIKDWYTTAEAATILKKAEFTVREWCRLGRVEAKKRQCGRGFSQEWIIAHAELQRVRNEGLLPLQR